MSDDPHQQGSQSLGPGPHLAVTPPHRRHFVRSRPRPTLGARHAHGCNWAVVDLGYRPDRSTRPQFGLTHHDPNCHARFRRGRRMGCTSRSQRGGPRGIICAWRHVNVRGAFTFRPRWLHVHQWVVLRR